MAQRLSLVSLLRRLVPLCFLIPFTWSVFCFPHSFYKHLGSSYCPWCSENSWWCTSWACCHLLFQAELSNSPFCTDGNVLCLSNVVASSYLRLLYTWDVALVAEVLHFWFHLFITSNCNSLHVSRSCVWTAPCIGPFTLETVAFQSCEIFLYYFFHLFSSLFRNCCGSEDGIPGIIL